MSKPYMWGETATSTKKATDLNPKTAAALLNSFDNPLFILGSDLDEYPGKTLSKIIEKSGGKFVLTGSGRKSDIDLNGGQRYGVVEVVDLLCAEDGWKDKHGCIVFAGVPYQIETRMLSGLRLCEVDNVITLNRRHQQYADYSFPNLLDEEKWKENLEEIAENI